MKKKARELLEKEKEKREKHKQSKEEEGSHHKQKSALSAAHLQRVLHFLNEN